MSEITIRQSQALNAIWRVKWADPIAAFAILPLIVLGKSAWHEIMNTNSN